MATFIPTVQAVLDYITSNEDAKVIYNWKHSGTLDLDPFREFAESIYDGMKAHTETDYVTDFTICYRQRTEEFVFKFGFDCDDNSFFDDCEHPIENQKTVRQILRWYYDQEYVPRLPNDNPLIERLAKDQVVATPLMVMCMLETAYWTSNRNGAVMYTSHVDDVFEERGNTFIRIEMIEPDGIFKIESEYYNETLEKEATMKVLKRCYLNTATPYMVAV